MPSSLPTLSCLAPLAEGTHPNCPNAAAVAQTKALQYPWEGHGD